jgi:hypothetical protein
MPRQATTDWNAADRAPEYPPDAGAKTSTENHPATETANEARGAVKGQGVNVVLAVSLGAVILAFAVIYVVFWA